MEGTPQKVWKKVKARTGERGTPPLPSSFFNGNRISKGEILVAGLCRESRSEGEERATPPQAGWLFGPPVLRILPPPLRVPGGEDLVLF